MSLRLAVTDMINKYNKKVRTYQSNYATIPTSMHFTNRLQKERIKKVLENNDYVFKNMDKHSDFSNTACIKRRTFPWDEHEVTIYYSRAPGFIDKQKADFSATQKFSAMNMACTCYKPAFGLICDHVIVAVDGFRMMELLQQSSNYLHGSDQRISQIRLYKTMKALDRPHFETWLYPRDRNLHLALIAMRKAGRPSNYKRIPSKIKVQRKRSKT